MSLTEIQPLDISDFFAADEWVHLAVVIKHEGTVLAYKNGNFVKSETFSSITGNNIDFKLGNIDLLNISLANLFFSSILFRSSNLYFLLSKYVSVGIKYGFSDFFMVSC